MNKIILVTGASSGFGKAIAVKFAAAGYHVIITARRMERLLDLQKTLEEKYAVKVLPLALDVTQKKPYSTASATFLLNGKILTSWLTMPGLPPAGIILTRRAWTTGSR